MLGDAGEPRHLGKEVQPLRTISPGSRVGGFPRQFPRCIRHCQHRAALNERIGRGELKTHGEIDFRVECGSGMTL
jgi:hypothetical protein